MRGGEAAERSTVDATSREQRPASHLENLVTIATVAAAANDDQGVALSQIAGATNRRRPAVDIPQTDSRPSPQPARWRKRRNIRASSKPTARAADSIVEP